MVFTGFIYQVWREKNSRIFVAKKKSALQVSLLIIQDIQLKLSSYVKTCSDIPENIKFMLNWNVDCICTLEI